MTDNDSRDTTPSGAWDNWDKTRHRSMRQSQQVKYRLSWDRDMKTHIWRQDESRYSVADCNCMFAHLPMMLSLRSVPLKRTTLHSNFAAVTMNNGIRCIRNWHSRRLLISQHLQGFNWSRARVCHATWKSYYIIFWRIILRKSSKFSTQTADVPFWCVFKHEHAIYAR